MGNKIKRCTGNLCGKATTRIALDLDISLKLRVYQELVLSLLLFATVIKIKDARKGLQHKIFYANDFAFAGDLVEEVRKRFAILRRDTLRV